MLDDCCVAHLCTEVLQVESEGHAFIPTYPPVDSREPVGSKRWTNRARGTLIPEVFSSARVKQGSAGNPNPCIVLHTVLYGHVYTYVRMRRTGSQVGGGPSR